MPALALAALAGFGFGFYSGDGVDGIGKGIKWAVIGGAGFVVWRNRAAIGGAFK